MAAPGLAYAGAWPVEEEGLAIISLTPMHLGETDADAATGEAPLGAGEAQLYLERPLARGRLSFVGRAFTSARPLGEAWTVRTEGDFALKAPLWRTARISTAVQLGATYSEDLLDECAGAGYEARGLAGRSIGNWAWMNVELAYRGHSQSCNALRGEAALGARSPWGVAMVQTYLEGTRSGAGADIKVQASFIRWLDNGVGVQVGVRARAAGDGPAETALVLAFWSRPLGKATILNQSGPFRP